MPSAPVTLFSVSTTVPWILMSKMLYQTECHCLGPRERITNSRTVRVSWKYYNSLWNLVYFLQENTTVQVHLSEWVFRKWLTYRPWTERRSVTVVMNNYPFLRTKHLEYMITSSILFFYIIYSFHVYRIVRTGSCYFVIFSVTIFLFHIPHYTLRKTLKVFPFSSSRVSVSL